MKIRATLAIAACRLTRAALRLLGRGGTDFPGRVALRLCPSLLGVLARDVSVLIVTGTNGKTTSARMLSQCLENAGYSYFSNKSGANLLSGITAEFAMQASLTGRPRHKWALIECDEAAWKTVSRYVDAKLVLVTNIFRDQLDRYGEVTHTLNNIRAGLDNSPNASLCLNADCSLSVSLSEGRDVCYYGVETPIYKERVAEVSDAPYCIRCKGEYVYDYVTYGHLGGFRCPQCGYARPEPQVAVLEIVSATADDQVIRVRTPEKELEARINLPGGYNVYNAAGVLAAAGALGIDADAAAAALGSFSCGFGRMEKFEIAGTVLRMILVKNPAGCNQVLNFLTGTDVPAVFAVCLNDRAADGTDISWIWDVDFEKLLQMGDRLQRVCVSGIRADDMALRLKYAGIPPEKLAVIQDYGALAEALLGTEAPVYIMPTYTAMLDLRDKISKTYGFKNFWE